MLGFFIVLIVGLGALGALALATRNRLATLAARIDNAWSQIDVQLQRRAETLPGLVAALEMAGVQASAEGDLRTGLAAGAAPGSLAAYESAQSEADGAVARLLALAETSGAIDDAGVAKAVDEVREAEKQVTYMRQSFNDTVARYNETLSAFPGSLLGPFFGFAPRPALQIDPALR